MCCRHGCWLLLLTGQVGVDGVRAFREGKAVLGSTADRLARVAKCPVVLVKDHNPRMEGTYSPAVFK